VCGCTRTAPRCEVVLDLLLLLQVHLLEVGLRVRPPLALETVLPHDKGEDGDNGDARNHTSGYRTNVRLAGRFCVGHGVQRAPDLGARVACRQLLHADFVGGAFDAVAAELLLGALDAALVEVEHILNVCMCQRFVL